MIPKASMVYYFNPKMYAGIFIDIYPDNLYIKRSLYTVTSWLGEVGGFQGAIQSIITMILPLIQVFSLEKYLVSALFQ